MNFRPPFSNKNYRFPPCTSNNNAQNINNLPQTNSVAFQSNIRNNLPSFHNVNSPTINRYHSIPPNALNTSAIQSGTSSESTNVPPNRFTINTPPLSYPNFINTRPHTFINFASQAQNVTQSFRPTYNQSCIRSVEPPITPESNNTNFNLEPRNRAIQHCSITAASSVASDFNLQPRNVSTQRFITPVALPINTNSCNSNFNLEPKNIQHFPPPTFSPVSVNSNNANFSFDHKNIPAQRFPPPVLTANSNSENNNLEPRNVPVQRFSMPAPSTTCTGLQPNNDCPRFQSNPANTPISLPSLPPFSVSMNENATNVLNLPPGYSVGNVNISASQTVIYTSPQTVSPCMNSSAVQMSLQLPLNNTSKSHILHITSNPVIHDKEVKVAKFLAKFSIKKMENKPQVTIPEFRYVVKAVVRMIAQLNQRKANLSKLLEASESEWQSVAQCTKREQEELSTLCSFLSSSDHLNQIIKKLKLIKKRRERKKKTKQNKLSENIIVAQKRKERDQEIDKWLDDIKEKNEKIKREAELKKEADYILLEVRRKIYEAKKTIEKIKVFEKLRNARLANATQKGLHVLSMHNTKFEKKMSVLKETMMKQLTDYEAEEKALKVMLETEQEGQREEEIQWKIKKMKAFQQKRQNNIMECLFGISDDPLPTDPLYLFHKYHTSANSSVENLIQIRQQWDKHIAEDGEVIPQHWVVPVAPSNASWEKCLETSIS